MQYSDYLIMNRDVRDLVLSYLDYDRQYSYFGKKVRRTKFYCVHGYTDYVYRLMDALLKFPGVKDAKYHENLFSSQYSITVYYK